ncbi:MAG: hypothetical protein Q4G08_00620 [Capnocytophaga sp.]|nr:hypothetical protein [Capnocytophaga sp.]
MDAKLEEEQKSFEQAEKEYETKERRDKIKNTDADFQKIYKKLAKKIHPDLYKDENEKQHKEELMKTLSALWENRDYLGLIQLTLTIDPDNEDDIGLSEGNLRGSG